jgi:hypothetical protein
VALAESFTDSGEAAAPLAIRPGTTDTPPARRANCKYSEIA